MRKRIIVVAAGPVMNILAAILFATVSLMSYGVYVDIPTVQELASETAPAAIAGIEPGDVLYAINGKVIESYDETSELILAASGDEMTVTVQRDGTLIDLTVRDFYNVEEGRNFIGIEKETKYFESAKKWIESEAAQTRLF